MVRVRITPEKVSLQASSSSFGALARVGLELMMTRAGGVTLLGRHQQYAADEPSRGAPVDKAALLRVHPTYSRVERSSLPRGRNANPITVRLRARRSSLHSTTAAGSCRKANHSVDAILCKQN